jgi:ornithine carbamoyltransferase
MYNLRNRSFLKEIDFPSREPEHLLTVAAALKAAKYAGTEVRRASCTPTCGSRWVSFFESSRSIMVDQAVLVATIGD